MKQTARFASVLACFAVVALANAFANDRSQRTDDGIAVRVPGGVVQRLQVVDVHEQRGVAGGASRERALNRVQRPAPIEQTGEPVANGSVDTL